MHTSSLHITCSQFKICRNIVKISSPLLTFLGNLKNFVSVILAQLVCEISCNFETNFFGPIEVIKAVLPQMREQKSGLIINVTSIAAYMGLPYRGIYSASKGALELVTEAISIEVKSFGINIVNIAPGEFATDIASHRYHAPILEGSVYKTPYENTLGMMNSHMHSGDNPEDLAAVVYQIIKDKNHGDRPMEEFLYENVLRKVSKWGNIITLCL